MKKISLATLAFLLPVAAFAQQVGTTYVTSAEGLVTQVLSWVMPVLITLALLFFFIELVRFIMAAPEAKAKARGGLLWSILALFLMLSVLGIIHLIQGLTGATGGGSIDATQVPTVNL